MNTVQAYQEALEMKDQLVRWRRDLHKVPEIDLNLPETMAYIKAALTKMQVAFTAYDDISCITVTFGKGGKCILLRADVDGLPMEEKSGEPFASENGYAHACGHDLHAATLLGVAKILKKHENELNGTVKLLFQSGEETFRGANAAIAKGIMEDPHVDTCFGMHVYGYYETGLIRYGHALEGSVFGFEMHVSGVGGHGSTPEDCVDPINAAVQIYLALQSLIAREIPASKEAVLTIGQLTAGAAPNIIPDTAILKGTLRTFDPDIRDYLKKRIREISEATAAAYRTKLDFRPLYDIPALIENDELLAEALEVAKEAPGTKAFDPGMHLMGSDDFALFSEMVPSCYLGSGAAPEDPARRFGQHHPEIVFKEDVMVNNIAIYLGYAWRYLSL